MQGLNQDYPLLLNTILDHAEVNYGDVAIVGRYPTETVRYDYRRAAARVRRLASSLSRLGVATGDLVGSLAWNTHRHFELFYGVTALGAVLHTANPRLAPEQIIYTINLAGYRDLFCDQDTLPLVEEIAHRLEHVKHIVVMASTEGMPTTSLPSVHCYEDLVGTGSEEFPRPALDERSACTLCFTSGTTGLPKGVLYSHRGTVLSAMSTGGGNGWGLSADDAIIAIAGLFHCNGWAVPFFGPMYGAKLVFPGRRADAEWLHALIVEEGVTVAPGVPTIWLAMLEYCRRTKQRLGRLNRIYSGGAAPPADMIEAYLCDYGVRTIHGWGMTETTHGATISFAAKDLPFESAVAMRTQGKPLYGNEIRIVDEAGACLPRDGQSIGHLQCRGHWIAGAYFRRPDVVVQSDDGWMRTGDMATIDPDNTLHIVDRAKDIVKSGGEWISSQALEEAVLSHPALQAAAVLSVPHPLWQERPLLILVSTPGMEITADGVRDHLRQCVPKWWLPETIVFVDELPHGSTGKIDKQVLRSWVAEGKVPLNE